MLSAKELNVCFFRLIYIEIQYIFLLFTGRGCVPKRTFMIISGTFVQIHFVLYNFPLFFSGLFPPKDVFHYFFRLTRFTAFGTGILPIKTGKHTSELKPIALNQSGESSLQIIRNKWV
jgi:hypothetical protein